MYAIVDDYEEGGSGDSSHNDGFGAVLGAGIDQTTAIALVVSLTVCFGENSRIPLHRATNVFYKLLSEGAMILPLHKDSFSRANVSFSQSYSSS